MITVLYFARLRDTLDCSKETLEYTTSLQTVANVIDLLQARGEPWLSAFKDPQLLIAINQEIANRDSHLQQGDELAFFPPVTGG